MAIPDTPLTREEQYLDAIVEALDGGGGGTSDYSNLSNKPSINGVTLSGNKTTSDLGITSAPMTEITYSALKTLRDGGNLVPGMQYRITDYETIITGSYDLSALGAQGYLHNAGVPESHPFDVIVVADDESHLNENARAALHEGDTYFANSTIGAWKLKYCLDNDQQTYGWANANGKGVIFWMEDEFNNRVGYDFKNIRFLRYALKVADAQGDYTPPADGKLAYDASTQPNRYGGTYQLFTALQAYMSAGSYVNPYLHQYKGNVDAVADYDFAVGANILGAIQFAEVNAQYLSAFGADWYYTFDYWDADESAHVDASLNGHPKVPCRENYIELETEPLVALMQGAYNIFGLGGSVWETNSVFVAGLSSTGWDSISGNRLGMHNWMNTFGDNCDSNTFGYNCYSNTFGDNCDSNTFGYKCYSNTFGDNCYSNTFGDNCDSNTFGYNCYSNTFGDNCDSNTFGYNCYSNTFGYNCSRNTFGDNCFSNTFGDYCDSNTFGDYCYSNTFGYNCDSNTFEDKCDSNTFGESCDTNTFGDSCSRNTFGDNCYSNTFGDNCPSNTFGDSCSSNTFGDYCSSNTFGDYCDSNTFGDYCYSNTFGYNCDSNTFGYKCYSNTFGTNDTNNNLRGYIRYAELGDRCIYVTVNSLGANVYFDGLEAGDFVQGLEVPAAQISQSGRYRLENYTNTGNSGLSSGGSATLIHKTGYNTETAVSTTDGGATWASA